ncbi:MAG: ribonuclease III [Rhodospirillaceae bacterium]|nr:ribonuclease III [Rhodospirillaceae bacterium]
MSNSTEIEDVLGYRFSDRALLETALTHSSAAGAHIYSNERLEFLGDRVLGIVIADILYNRFEDEDEGSLARRFSALTSRDAIAEVAGSLGIEKFVEMSPADDATSERGRLSLLADTVEALLGAMFLDSGLDGAGGFIKSHWETMIEANINPPKDAKTELQEWTQAKALGLPEYKIIEQSGPDHAPLFKVEVEISNYGKYTGSGSSRRNAEMEAAKAFLETTGKNK